MPIIKYREQIDDIDSQISNLISQRMEIVGKVAKYKKDNNLPILDSDRERTLIEKNASRVPEDFRPYLKTLYSVITDISKSYQSKLINGESNVSLEIKTALETTSKLFPQKATVACQGALGAYSQLACEKLFEAPSIMYFKSFEHVFSAVNSGLCEYGILPLENSTAGSVNKIYDLMTDYNFNIVRSIKLRTTHTLMSKDGVDIGDIREIISHEQAINQCSNYIKNLDNVKVTYCENTAVAAKLVRESDRKDIAAIASYSSAEIYGLRVLNDSIQNSTNNYTRFICISRKPEIYPGANKTSFMMVIPHKPGALYKVMSKFSAYGVNLTKLESRPLPGRDFEFLFYMDLECSVYSPVFTKLIDELYFSSESFKYLGSYLEVL